MEKPNPAPEPQEPSPRGFPPEQTPRAAAAVSIAGHEVSPGSREEMLRFRAGDNGDWQTERGEGRCNGARRPVPGSCGVREPGTTTPPRAPLEGTRLSRADRKPQDPDPANWGLG